MNAEIETNYALIAEDASAAIPIPDLAYHPPMPKRYRPKIGLIGCGGISGNHLAAYRDAGWEVAICCDTDPERAVRRRDEFFPGALVCRDYHELLKRPEVDVVDITLHPEPRAAVMADCLKAGRHVLSQKPFVLDLETGQSLVRLAKENGVKLAVNQNGRFAPYVRFASQAVSAGLLGTVQTVEIRLNWDHTWCQGTPFERIHHLVLYDFGIHWFDMCALFFGDRPATRVFAQVARANNQVMAPPMLAQASIAFDQGLASVLFDAHSKRGPEESIQITGSAGTLRTRGSVVANDHVELFTNRGWCQPRLEGRWFNDGFRGAMGELLCAVEENREPSHSAENNLRSLEICFAALKSADTGQAQRPGEVRGLPIPG